VIKDRCGIIVGWGYRENNFSLQDFVLLLVKVEFKFVSVVMYFLMVSHSLHLPHDDIVLYCTVGPPLSEQLCASSIQDLFR